MRHKSLHARIDMDDWQVIITNLKIHKHSNLQVPNWVLTSHEGDYGKRSTKGKASISVYMYMVYA